MKKRIRKIAGKIIEDSFPVLKGEKIIYLVFYLRFYAFSVWIPPYFRLITLSTRAGKLDDFVIEGILAHELCHQERYIKMGFWRYLRFIFSYTFDKNARYLEERATDTLTIEKGYAHQLYELTLISNNDPKHKTIIGNYLSPEEIKSYAVKIGKW
ncbi:MAG TPA: hypothetical protein VMT63_12420 [Bacteroidales bacterium]|nr:hypothetical protein [Bacteroidales bacterium]